MRGLARRTWFTFAVAAASRSPRASRSPPPRSSAPRRGAPGPTGAPRGEAGARSAPAIACAATCERHRAALTDRGRSPTMPFATEDAAARRAGPRRRAPPPGVVDQRAGGGRRRARHRQGRRLDDLRPRRRTGCAPSTGRRAVPALLDSIELPGGPRHAYADERELLLAGDRALVISRTLRRLRPSAYVADRTLLDRARRLRPGRDPRAGDDERRGQLRERPAHRLDRPRGDQRLPGRPGRGSRPRPGLDAAARCSATAPRRSRSPPQPGRLRRRAPAAALLRDRRC